MTFAALRYRLADRMKRIANAWRYATGALSPQNARDMILELEDTAGWYGLVTLAHEDIMARLANVYEYSPELDRLAFQAMAHVGHKSEDTETLAAAIDWTIEMVEEMADEEGVTLVQKDDKDAQAAA
jgi:hypothetical protein